MPRLLNRTVIARTPCPHVDEDGTVCGAEVGDPCRGIPKNQVHEERASAHRTAHPRGRKPSGAPATAAAPVRVPVAVLNQYRAAPEAVQRRVREEAAAAFVAAVAAATRLHSSRS